MSERIWIEQHSKNSVDKLIPQACTQPPHPPTLSLHLRYSNNAIQTPNRIAYHIQVNISISYTSHS